MNWRVRGRDKVKERRIEREIGIVKGRKNFEGDGEKLRLLARGRRRKEKKEGKKKKVKRR